MKFQNFFECPHCKLRLTAIELVDLVVAEYKGGRNKDGLVYCPKCGEFETKNFLKVGILND